MPSLGERNRGSIRTLSSVSHGLGAAPVGHCFPGISCLNDVGSCWPESPDMVGSSAVPAYSVLSGGGHCRACIICLQQHSRGSASNYRTVVHRLNVHMHSFLEGNTTKGP